MTEQELATWKVKIDGMSHQDLASLQRFARVGHPIFRNDLPLYEHFEKRFQALGGMTVEVSKAIGW